MKINLPERVYEGTGVQAEQVMTIKADAMMFQKFAKDLYKNPLKACFRELLSNAVDACNLDPSGVTVTLPSILDKTLVIDDTGRGMSHEFVLTRYSVVGETTKSDTNGQIGGFGMGKMTSLALTNAYSLVCNDPNDIRTYTCFKNAQGIPNVALTFRGNNITSKRSGVTVRVPIDPSKFNELQEYAKFLQKTFYLTYGKTFKIIGMPFDEASFKDKDVGLYQPGVGAHLLKGSNEFYVCIGGIPYQVDMYKYSLRNKFTYFGKSILLFANIGDFNVTLSREELEESTSSKQKIERLVEKYLKYCESEAELFYNATIAHLSEKEKLQQVSSIKGELKLSYLASDKSEKLNRYTHVTNYISAIFPNHNNFSNSLVILSGKIRRFKSRTEYVSNDRPKNSYRILCNDTKLSCDLLFNRIVRASTSGKPLPTILKDVSYLFLFFDKKTRTELEALFPALDVVNATDILKEFYPDKKDFEKYCSEIKNYERIRFKKALTNGNVVTLTIDEIENLQDKVYYTTVDNKNYSSLFKAGYKDTTKIKKWMQKLALQEVYLVPQHKEKYLDTAIFAKLDDILKDNNNSIFKGAILEEACYAFYKTNSTSIDPIKNDYRVVNCLKNYSVPTDFLDFINLSSQLTNLHTSYSDLIVFENNFHFKAELKRLETVLSKTLELQTKLKLRYPLIVGYRDEFQLLSSGKAYINAVVSYLNSLPT